MKLPIKKDLTEKDLYLLNSLRRKERVLNDEKDILYDKLNKVLVELDDIRIKIDDIELA